MMPIARTSLTWSSILLVVAASAWLLVAACAPSDSAGTADADAGSAASPGRPRVGALKVVAAPGLRTSEDGTRATFTVALTRAPTATVTVPIASSNEAEIRVEPSALTFTPARWAEPQVVTLLGQNDDVADGDRKVDLRVGPASSADSAFNGVEAPTVEATNADDDTPGVVVAPPFPYALTNEAGGAATFTVRLRSRPTATVTIPVQSSLPTEGRADVTELSFAPGTWNQSVTVTVTGQNDDVADGDRAYAIVLGAATSSDPNYAGLDPDDVALVNQDDDAPGVFVSAPSPSSVTTEAGGAVTFTVRLRSKPAADVSVAVASSKPAEGTASAAALAFTPANYATPQTVTVTGRDDPVDDGDQPYVVSVGPSTSADAAYAAVPKVDVALTNKNDDTAGVLVGLPAPSNLTTEAGGQVTIAVRLASAPTATVTLPVSSSKPTEGAVSATSLVFTAATWNVSQTLTVTGQNDFVDDGDVAYAVVLGAATSADPKYGGLDPADVPLVNVDDDTAGITVSAPLPSAQTTEAGGAVTFSVVLASQPLADVTVGLTSSKPAEGQVNKAQLVFTSATWSVAQTVTVTGIDDFVDDGDVAYAVVTAAAVSADPKYGGLDPADVALVNVDNDTAGIVVSAPAPSNATTEAGGKVTFTVALASEPLANVTVPVSSSVVTEGTVDKAQLVFTPATWSVAQTVTVTGQSDAVIDGDVPYSIVLAAATSVDPKYALFDAPDVALVNRSVCYAVKTTGPAAHVAMPSAGWSLGTADWTLEFWVKVHADFVNASGKLIYMNEGYAASNVQTQLDDQGRVLCGTYHDACPCTKGSGNLTLASAPLAAGAWHHVACVRTGGTGQLYVDGALADTDVVDVNLAANSGLSVGQPAGYPGYTSAPVVLGPWRFSSTARYVGAAAFTPTKGWVVDPSTVSQFLVSGGLVGTTITDEAGGDNNGTVTSGVVGANAESPCAP